MSLRIPRIPRVVSHAFGSYSPKGDATYAQQSCYTRSKAESLVVFDNQVVEAIMQSPWEMMQRSQKG